MVAKGSGFQKRLNGYEGGDIKTEFPQSHLTAAAPKKTTCEKVVLEAEVADEGRWVVCVCEVGSVYGCCC